MALLHVYADWAVGNDYKGVTINDGAWDHTTLTLAKTGAFAASAVNHWLYLTDNGSGEVTPGYYRITSVAGAPDAVVLHADIRSGANDPTDVRCIQHDGTVALPARSIQGALDLFASEHTQINVKAGAAQILQSPLDCTIYGAPGVGKFLWLRGYTAAANDGGMAEIDCNGNTMWASPLYQYITHVDLEIHTFGDNNGIAGSHGFQLFRCNVHRGASTPSGKALVNLGWAAASRVEGCYIHDIGTGGSRALTIPYHGIARGNFIELAESDQGYGIYHTDGINAIGNVILCRAAAQTGIQGAYYAYVVGNTIYNLAGGTASGIVLAGAARANTTCLGNIVAGWSGVGGSGILASNARLGHVGYNAFYNNTTNYALLSSSEIYFDDRAYDVTLAADPFVNAAGRNLELTDVAKTALRSAGWPATILGSMTDLHLTIGAVQYGAAEVGGGAVSISPWRGGMIG